VNLSARSQATFASRRKEIYTLFESYLKMKRSGREHDAADRFVLVSHKASNALTMQCDSL
jgi:hypothetical protein